MFLVKRHVVFSKTIRCFFDDEVFSPPSAVTLVTAKNKTPSTRARIRARVRTSSASTASPNLLPHPSELNPQKHSPTKKYSSAMKQPTTNHSSNAKPILICTTYTPISQNKDNKTKYRQRKNGTNMPFFHSLGVFPSIY